MLTADYDVIGRGYGATRGEDPRLAAAIDAALGDARTVLNVGAVFTFDPAHVGDVWLLRDYLPEFTTLYGMSLDEVAAAFGATAVEAIPIPRDCADGFLHAFWRRPHAYLDPEVRAHISVFARLGEEAEAAFVARLARDLDSGAWQARNADILSLDALDCGYRLLVAERA